MIAMLLDHLSDLSFLLTSPVWLVFTIFWLWMLIDALRNREWIWALFIFIGSGLGAVWYYFTVYRGSTSASSGFELPGAQSRKHIRQLKAKIHHIDNAYHHFQLGDVYFQQGKFADAEKSYRAALERDATDIDTRAHLGQCLLRLKRPAEAKPLLKAVCRENFKHDFGYSLMAYAETLAALNETDAALGVWQHVVEHHSYPRAKVQLADLYIAKKQFALARAQLNDVVNDDSHAPTFQRKRDRVWIKRARAALKTLPA